MKALITGASSGLGEEFSYILANRGYEVILVATDREKLARVASKCQNKAKIMVADLRSEKDVYSIYEKFNDEDIDILINNAGFGLFGHFVETDLQREMEMVDVNIKAVHILTKLFLKDFCARNRGYILNVASSAGFMAGPKLSTYYSTKNYVLKLSLAIYEELRRMKSSVHISVLCPGPVDTNFNKVAGGVFATKGANSRKVANYAIDKMFAQKLVIIPGIYMKLAIFFTRIIPIKTALKFIYNFQSRKIER